MKSRITKTVIDGNGKEYGIGDEIKICLRHGACDCVGVICAIEETKMKLHHVRIDDRPMSSILTVPYHEVIDCGKDRPV